ncbi:hypothetical protein [Paenibacillus sp. MSJ-34]|uniref:hypothetical protein n=1 Tax=Paenibacillus sp. MSJ-34 TaxID=2841529 RepID=UPI001C0FCE81|nr:hypothetical protein [Paenibacillus sp. MSJ-34]MBU5443071.1 hypothetical protein [Paenibacillus sp. MSJ-34]
MQNKKYIDRLIILISGYLFLLLIIGVFFVPCIKTWGPNKERESAVFAPIWKLMDSYDHNGYSLIYEINTDRILLEILIVSLIAVTVFLLIHTISKAK